MFENLSKKKEQSQPHSEKIASKQEKIAQTQENSLFLDKSDLASYQKGKNQITSPKGGNKAHPSSSQLKVSYHPPIYLGKNSENKATPNPSPAAHHQHLIPLQRIKPSKTKCKVKPPANFEYKPIYQHFKKSIQTDKPSPDRKDVQTGNSDVLTLQAQAKQFLDKDREGKN